MNIWRNTIGGLALIVVFFGVPVGLALLAGTLGLPARLLGCLALLAMAVLALLTFRSERLGGNRTGILSAVKHFTFPQPAFVPARRRRKA